MYLARADHEREGRKALYDKTQLGPPVPSAARKKEKKTPSKTEFTPSHHVVEKKMLCFILRSSTLQPCLSPCLFLNRSPSVSPPKRRLTRFAAIGSTKLTADPLTHLSQRLESAASFTSFEQVIECAA